MSFVRTCLSIILLLVVCSHVPGAAARPRSKHPPRGPQGLLLLPEVHRELRLSEQQIEQVSAYVREMRSKSEQLFRNLQKVPREERERRFREFRAEARRRMSEILDSKQRERLRQIEVQSLGDRALDRPEIQEELRLTSEQRQRIAAILDHERESLREAFQSFRGQSMSDEQRQDAWGKYRDIRAATNQKLSSVLTDSQRKQFQHMQGAPFRFPERHFRYRNQ